MVTSIFRFMAFTLVEDDAVEPFRGIMPDFHMSKNSVCRAVLRGSMAHLISWDGMPSDRGARLFFSVIMTARTSSRVRHIHWTLLSSVCRMQNNLDTEWPEYDWVHDKVL